MQYTVPQTTPVPMTAAFRSVKGEEKKNKRLLAASLHQVSKAVEDAPSMSEYTNTLAEFAGKLQELEATIGKYSLNRSNFTDTIAQSDIQAAQKQYEYVQQQLEKQMKEENSPWHTIAKVFEGIGVGIVDLVALCTQNYAVAAITTALYVASVTGLTTWVTNELADGIEKLHPNMPKDDAKAIAAVVVTLVVIAGTLGAGTFGEVNTAAIELTDDASLIQKAKSAIQSVINVRGSLTVMAAAQALSQTDLLTEIVLAAHPNATAKEKEKLKEKWEKYTAIISAVLSFVATVGTGVSMSGGEEVTMSRIGNALKSLVGEDNIFTTIKWSMGGSSALQAGGAIGESVLGIQLGETLGALAKGNAGILDIDTAMGMNTETMRSAGTEVKDALEGLGTQVKGLSDLTKGINAYIKVVQSA